MTPRVGQTNDTDERILDTLRTHPRSSVDEIMALTGKSQSAVRHNLALLVGGRQVVRGRYGRIFRYALSDNLAAQEPRP